MEMKGMNITYDLIKYYRTLLRCILSLLLFTTYTVTENEGLQDYCERDTMHANCSNGEVILMQEARYGRMKIGTCIAIDMGFMDCFSDVLPVMDQWCSGQQSCDVQVINIFLNVPSPCPMGLRSYLEASFTCVSVWEAPESCCQSGDQQILEADKGYLSSTVTLDTGCGSTACPWQINAPNGQNLDVFIWDFNQHLAIVDDEISESHCYLYAVIREKAAGVTLNICATAERRSQLYTTSTNSLEISIITDVAEDVHPQFLIEFQAFGCVDPLPPDNGFVDRNDDFATVGCLGSDANTWEIICRNGEWIGDFGDCTTDLLKISTSGPSLPKNDTDVQHIFNWSISEEMVVILIIAVAIILSLAFLVICVVCILKRRSVIQRTRQKQTWRHENKPCYNTCKPSSIQDDYLNHVDIPYIHRPDSDVKIASYDGDNYMDKVHHIELQPIENDIPLDNKAVM